VSLAHELSTFGEGATIPVSAVIFREDLYPRIETNPVTVQKYAEDLEVLPAIEVNQRNELIDGWHRWTAHKKASAQTIKVRITPTASDGELLELAIERNAAHGLQLSQDDKRDMARRIYHITAERDRDAKKTKCAGL
jgi:ParB-like chromosome segregation protein Spo0J